MTQEELAKLQQILNYNLTDEGIDENIENAKNFIPVGGITNKVSSISPRAFEVFKNLFKPNKTNAFSKPLSKAKNLNYLFSPEHLKRFPVNRYNRVTPTKAQEESFKELFSRSRQFMKNPNIPKINPKDIQIAKEIALANKIRRPAGIAAGISSIGATDYLINRSNQDNDNNTIIDDNKTIVGEPVELTTQQKLDNVNQKIIDYKKAHPNANLRNQGIYTEIIPQPKPIIETGLEENQQRVDNKSTKKPKTTYVKNKTGKPKTVSHKIAPVKNASSNKTMSFKEFVKAKQQRDPKLSVYNIMDADKNLEGRGIDW